MIEVIREEAKKMIDKVMLSQQVKVGDGCFLVSSADLIADQYAWDSCDLSKTKDFTISPMWITTDDGQTPRPIQGVDELADLLEELGY